MDILREIVLVIHFIGLASLFGGFFVQMTAREKVINNAMFHGILVQLVTGILLVGLREMQELDVNQTKVAVKLGIAAVIAVLVVVNRKKPTVSLPVWGLIGGLTVVNIAIAVIW
ncbi:unannotated protein [freshwater metagenome]|uniref:Unannotated protein n=1 Tax=freshwater metagenome TaxID=449393 RepID=A0A6J6BBD2_9ZZZZ|nr:hypothetical protein [Actinomycetota bacterium]